MPLAAGARLGPYEIVAPIGAGGMGEVYRARDTKLGRDVAIKVLPEEFARDKERLDRFEREAHLLAQLNHSNVATLYGLEEHAGRQCLVMELVEGDTLAERLPLPVAEAIPIFIQIADGLDAAHEKRIVHRDLKPANIKITPDGQPKILDFGLARAATADHPGSPQTESPTVTRHTEMGVILGTAPYMSPEQARGKVADQRTDVWAFGCCLYEALTGKAAFLGDTVSDTIAAILDRDPDWDRLPAEMPPSVRRLLKRSLQKDHRRRLQTIGDARLELEETHDDIPRAVARPKGFGPLALAGAGMLAALATIIVYRTSAPNDIGHTVVRSVLPLAEGERLALLRRTASVAISPDGQHVAYIAERDGTRKLYLRSLNDLTATPVEGSEAARTPFFSPDSGWLGFSVPGELMRAPVAGGATLSIATLDDQSRGSSWSTDDEIVYTPSYVGGLSRISVGGGETTLMTEAERERNETTHRLPHVLPGADVALFTIGTTDIDTFDDAEIAAIDLVTGDKAVLLKGGTNAQYSPSGHLVYARDGSLFAVALDVDGRRTLGEPIRVLDGVANDTLYGTAEFSLSRNGSLLYAPGSASAYQRQLIWIDRSGRSQPLTTDARAYNGLRLSPDGAEVAVHIEGANNSVWVHNLDRGTLTRVTSNFHNWKPAWSPESRRLAIVSNREGVDNLFVLAADGSGEPARLTTSEHRQLTEDWSPDGDTLLFSEFHPETLNDIWSVSMTDPAEIAPLVQTEHDEGGARFSPDGRWVAYVSDASGRYEVYIVSFPDASGKRQVSIDGGMEPVWSPNGDELFYRDGTKMMVVDIELGENLSLGSPVLLYDLGSDYLSGYSVTESGYDVTRDGRFLRIQETVPEPPPDHLILVQNFAAELNRLVPPAN